VHVPLHARLMLVYAAANGTTNLPYCTKCL
jgi:hypothetical protein